MLESGSAGHCHGQESKDRAGLPSSTTGRVGQAREIFTLDGAEKCSWEVPAESTTNAKAGACLRLCAYFCSRQESKGRAEDPRVRGDARAGPSGEALRRQSFERLGDSCRITRKLFLTDSCQAHK